MWINQDNIIKLSLVIFVSVLFMFSKNMILKTNHKEKLTQMTIPVVDFDRSMELEKYQTILQNPSMQKLYTSCKQVYNKHHSNNIHPDEKIRIPKKIHQIWLGGNGNLPQEYKFFQKSWQMFHPDWEYKLWTEKDIPLFPFKNKNLFDSAVNFGEKSDIWRYEILEKEGGLYVDIDFECLSPFDILHHTYDFYIGIQPMDTNIVQLGIGLIGARPGHPLLKTAITNLPKNQSIKQIVLKTGPIFFTRIFYNWMLQSQLRDIAFPASYFYPCGYNQRNMPPDHWLKPETFAVHHWAGSWLKKEAFIKT